MTHYDRREARRLKEEGLDRASMSKAELLKVARGFALEHAKLSASDFSVTTDDVRIRLEASGYPTSLGAAWGAVFRGKDWQWTGLMHPSTYVPNHGRMIKVWRRA